MCELFTSYEFWKIGLPALIAISVAFVSHQLAVSRQLAEQRRKQKIDYLISSFTSLMMYSNNRDKEAVSHLRNASIAIQFLGTSEQSKLMQEFIDTLSEGKSAELDPLLFSLRNDIRSELNLEKITGPVYWVHPTI
jgi:hypothetical protein